MHHSTNVVREHEKPQAVRFESEEARDEFEAGLAVVRAHKSGNGLSHMFAVPFICWFSSEDVLSDNAVYNDEVKACDTNGDNLITLREATAYHARVRAAREADEPKKPATEANLANGTPVTIHGHIVLDDAPKAENKPADEMSVAARPPDGSIAPPPLR